MTFYIRVHVGVLSSEKGTFPCALAKLAGAIGPGVATSGAWRCHDARHVRLVNARCTCEEVSVRCTCEEVSVRCTVLQCLKSDSGRWPFRENLAVASQA